jgi:hypothetical protein
MIISNIGSIVLSLCPENASGVKSAESITTTQVRLLSISNTSSRLLSGPLADFISPLTSHGPQNEPSRAPRYRISRVMLLSGISLLLAGTFIYLELAIRTPDSFRVLRYVIITRFVFAHYSTGLSVLVPVLPTVPHSQFCASVSLLFFMTHTSRPDPDQALYPRSGETVTSGATSGS